MHLYEFLAICNDDTILIEFLIAKSVFREEINCPICSSMVKLTRDLANLKYYCRTTYYKQVHNKKKCKMWCNFKVSALSGTWFAHSRLPIATVYRFISYFLTIRPPRQCFLQEELEMSPHTVVDWSHFCSRSILFILQLYAIVKYYYFKLF